MGEESESINYLSADDSHDIHELVVEANAETTAGVASPGDIEYAVVQIQEGQFGQGPESPRDGIPVPAAYYRKSSVRRWQQANGAHVDPNFLRAEWPPL